MEVTKLLFGSVTVPAIAGVGLGLHLASGGMAGGMAAMIGAAAGVVGVPLNFTLYYGGGAAIMPPVGLPYRIGAEIGRIAGYAAYSLFHPRETYKEIVMGEFFKPSSDGVFRASSAPQPVVHQAGKNLKSVFYDAGTDNKNTPPVSDVPAVKKDAPKP